jgi:hypothetical protein
LAVKAFRVLGLTNPREPITTTRSDGSPLSRVQIYLSPVDEHQLGTWRLWYEQVKAGTRAFRFEGDPREYRLADPPSARQRPPKPDASPVVADAGKETNAASAWWPYLIGVGALLAALGYAAWHLRQA